MKKFPKFSSTFSTSALLNSRTIHVSSFTYTHDDYWESSFDPLTVQNKLLDIAHAVAWIKCALVMASSCSSCYALVVTIYQHL